MRPVWKDRSVDRGDRTEALTAYLKCELNSWSFARILRSVSVWAERRFALCFLVFAYRRKSKVFRKRIPIWENRLQSRRRKSCCWERWSCLEEREHYLNGWLKWPIRENRSALRSATKLKRLTSLADRPVGFEWNPFHNYGNLIVVRVQRSGQWSCSLTRPFGEEKLC